MLYHLCGYGFLDQENVIAVFNLLNLIITRRSSFDAKSEMRYSSATILSFRLILFVHASLINGQNHMGAKLRIDCIRMCFLLVNRVRSASKPLRRGACLEMRERQMLSYRRVSLFRRLYLTHFRSTAHPLHGPILPRLSFCDSTSGGEP
jgi:hypothetical protein